GRAHRSPMSWARSSMEGTATMARARPAAAPPATIGGPRLRAGSGGAACSEIGRAREAWLGWGLGLHCVGAVPGVMRGDARVDEATNQRPLRLLVVMPSWVGDAVMATPALRLVRDALRGSLIGA